MINSKNILILIVIGLVLYLFIKNKSTTEQMANTKKQKKRLIKKIKKINPKLTKLNNKNIAELKKILTREKNLFLVNNLSKLPNKYFLSDYTNINKNSGKKLKNHIKLLKIKCPDNINLEYKNIRKLKKSDSIELLSSLAIDDDNNCINNFETDLRNQKYIRDSNLRSTKPTTRPSTRPSTIPTSRPTTRPTLGGSKSSDISLVRDNGGGNTN